MSWEQKKLQPSTVHLKFIEINDSLIYKAHKPTRSPLGAEFDTVEE